MSGFEFSCLHCGQHLASDTALSGRPITCPSCHNTIVVPEEASAPNRSLPAIPPAPPRALAEIPIAPPNSGGLPDPVLTAIKRSFAFDGRIGRETFWLTCGWILITRKLADALPNAGVLTLSLLALSLWLALAMQVKRWHDRGKSGWMILIHLIPIVGTVWSMAELGFFPGTIGANRYGEDPLQPEDNCTEQAGFRLLAQATRLEGSGRGQEALVAYKDIADRYAHTAAGQDARKSAESLVLSTGIPTLSGNADHVSVVLPQTTVAGLTLSGMPWTQPPPLMPVPDRFVRPKISRLAVASFVLPLSALVVPPLIIVPLFRLGLGEVKATVVATVLAGWLMVSSGVWVAGIFLGHSALRRIKRSSRALKGSGWNGPQLRFR